MSPRITEGGPFAAILKAIGPDSGVQPCVGSMKYCAHDSDGENLQIFKDVGTVAWKKTYWSTCLRVKF
jgi:hypothetical protein